MIQDSSSTRVAEKIRALIAEARQHLQRGDARRAEDVLEDARDTATAAADLSDDLPEARALAFAESALLYQQLGNLHAARAFFRKAGQFAEEAPPARVPQAAILRISTLVNLIGVHARLKEYDEGRSVAATALGLLQTHAGFEGAAVLRFGALQNGAAVELQSGQGERALPMLQEAVAAGQALLTGGMTPLMPQVLDALNQLARLQAQRGDVADARLHLEQAARMAEARYEAGDTGAWVLVVNTRLQLARFEFGQRRFAETEDHLWKAVEVTQDVRPLVQVATFYLDLLRLPDAVLEEGGLPRAEVLEAWPDIMERLSATALVDDAREILTCRFAVLRDRDRAAAGPWQDRDPSDSTLEPVVRELLGGLKQDLVWLREGAGAG